ncbi:uncharacterized protein LOC124653347 [Lolium rigidum]|uniref:uncharacterized protein LOC124653347 n=1 Tax=Lolium rigidum TaxID=89674 RepID=UPI001F5D6D66|nr:uncharacterized protein LOC124653347 [Lolium rigidum]
MSSSTSSSAPLIHNGLSSSFPSRVRAFFPSCINPVSPFSAVASVHVSSQRSPLSPPPRAAAGGDQENRVQELRVPDSWLTPAGAAQESEWLRETLHKWLDDEYCPEPANVDISNTAARSYQESLTAKQSDVGEILMKMVGDLQELSYQESFHGAFSAANAAVRLITQRMESSPGE